MARLRAPSSVVVIVLNSRTEGMGAWAAGRTFGKSHSTILRWEDRLANQVDAWSPPAPGNQTVTLEGDEVYTRVGENLPQNLSAP
jgi:phage baseplate assembly protein gpV